MAGTGDARLASVRETMERRDWVAACDELVAAEPLSVPGLMLLAEAAYGAGRLEVTLEALERAHTQAQRSDDRLGAGAAAVRLAMHLVVDTGLLAPVRAWIGRAERLLDGLEETPVHAWLFVVRACERMLAGAFATAREWGERAAEAGDRQGNRDAAVFGRNVVARCLIFEGEIDRGLELLDEVAACLPTGELDALTAGLLYCEVVCAWQGVARYDQAEEWTDAMERFGSDHGVGSVSGRCRVHRAEILRLRGDLADAEREALLACAELRPYLRHEFGWPLTELGRIRLARGNLPGAEAALVEAHEIGWDAHPNLARLRLALGDVTGALASITDALEHPVNAPSKERPPNSELRRAPLLEAAVEIAIEAGDRDAARQACDELGGIATAFGGKALAAGAALASGRVRLADGDYAGARRALQDAVHTWSEIGAPYETAVARRALAQTYRAEGKESSALLEERAAESVFARLTAQHGPPAEAMNRFGREGEYWTIVFDGRTVRLRDAKGLRHLARLLSDPGREFHVVDLVALDRGAVTENTRRDPELMTWADAGAGALLDERAKHVYRRRLEEIDEDIEEAREFGDDERAARAETEKAFLLRELSRAVGLGGRDRRAGAASERARAAVTRAIRHAMAKIGQEHATLGEHLERTIRTGTYCVYLPDPRTPIDWSQ